MFTLGHEGHHEGVILYLMTNTSLNTLQVKLMWVGEIRAKTITGASCNREDI